MRRLPLKLAALAGFGLLCAGAGYAPPAAAATHVSVGLRIGAAPPPSRFERMPRHRSGYAWAPGYWRWDARARGYVRVGGYWVPSRSGRDYRLAGRLDGRYGGRFQHDDWRR